MNGTTIGYTGRFYRLNWAKTVPNQSQQNPVPQHINPHMNKPPTNQSYMRYAPNHHHQPNPHNPQMMGHNNKMSYHQKVRPNSIVNNVPQSKNQTLQSGPVIYQQAPVVNQR